MFTVNPFEVATGEENVGTKAPAAETLKVIFAVALCPPVEVAVTVNSVDEIVVVGVPLKTPLVVSKLNPVGIPALIA